MSESATEQMWRQHAEALKESEARAWALVGRAAPFVNAVAAMAEDKAPSLGWLADAGIAKDQRPALREVYGQDPSRVWGVDDPR